MIDFETAFQKYRQGGYTLRHYYEDGESYHSFPPFPVTIVNPYAMIPMSYLADERWTVESDDSKGEFIYAKRSFEQIIDDDGADISNWITKIMMKRPESTYKVSVKVEEVELKCDEA